MLAAEADATEVHEAAVEGADDAEATAADVAAEPDPEDGLGPSRVTKSGRRSRRHRSSRSRVEALHPPQRRADESTAAPEDGLGSVEGDEVLAAEADATEVHEAAVEGADSRSHSGRRCGREHRAPEDGLGRSRVTKS